MSTDDKVPGIGPMAGTSDIHPLPSHCVRCRYDLTGVHNPLRVCPECGLDNSDVSLAVLARRIRVVERIGYYAAAAAFVGVAAGFGWMLRMMQDSRSPYAHRQWPVWAPPVVGIGVGVMAVVCGAGMAMGLSSRGWVVGSRAWPRAMVGFVLGLLLSLIAVAFLLFAERAAGFT